MAIFNGAYLIFMVSIVMKKTFTAVMPDKVGVFLLAEEVFASLNLNITRISYNKAVDSRMLFIEVEGEEQSIISATEQLHALGYLSENKKSGNVILFEFRLENRSGSLMPVLELINQYSFNISYMSSQESDTDYQFLRMGLFIENDDDISSFIKSVVKICDVKIINYNQTGLSLDNTVFYMTFANKIAEQNNLNDVAKQNLLVDTNIIMETLAKKDCQPHAVFESIGKFAENLIKFKGDKFNARVSAHDLNSGIKIRLIEPPCGSNTCIIETKSEIIAIDGGFTCYQRETLNIIKDMFPNFDDMHQHLLLTHADIDHVGLTGVFNNIYVSQKSYDNFICELQGRSNIREKSAHHAPYVRISKILSHYKTPPMEKLCIIGGSSQTINTDLTEKIGILQFDGLCLEVYEVIGGHLPGEIVFIEREHRLCFSGDIIVNIKGFTDDQAEFNRLAPHLVTSVDSDQQLAAEERKAVLSLLDAGQWLIIGGHGLAMEVSV